MTRTKAEVEKPKVVKKMSLEKIDDAIQSPQDIGKAGEGIDLGEGFVLVNMQNLMYALYDTKSKTHKVLDTRRKDRKLSEVVKVAQEHLGKMTVSSLKKYLQASGVEIIAGRFIRKSDVKMIVDAADVKTMHPTDNILEGMTLDDLITTVQNESTAYNQRKERKALELIIVREYDKYISSLLKDARFTLNKNIDFIVAELLKRWKS
jgi:hypothetical protein